jgi:hypothetical protein
VEAGARLDHRERAGLKHLAQFGAKKDIHIPQYQKLSQNRCSLLFCGAKAIIEKLNNVAVLRGHQSRVVFFAHKACLVFRGDFGYLRNLVFQILDLPNNYFKISLIRIILGSVIIESPGKAADYGE